MRVSALALVLVSLAIAQPRSSSQGATQPRPLHIIVFGARINDPEIKVSGLVAGWVAQGHKVKFVEMTHGNVDYVENEFGRWPAAPEVAKCARILGIETQVIDMATELTASLETRRTIARLIRQWQADIVIGPRPYDEALLAASAARGGPLDAAYRHLGPMLNESAATVTSPFFLREVPPMPRSPIYLNYDNYQQPPSFDPAIVAGFDNVAEKKWKCLAAVPLRPADIAGGDWHTQFVDDMKNEGTSIANKYRERLVALYGVERAQKIKYAEAFELSKYGRQVTTDELLQMFPK